MVHTCHPSTGYVGGAHLSPWHRLWRWRTPVALAQAMEVVHTCDPGTGYGGGAHLSPWPVRSQHELYEAHFKGEKANK